MAKWYWHGLVIIVAIGLMVIVVMLVMPKPPIPSAVKNQVTSTLMLPKSNAYPVARPSVKYDPGLKMLSFTLTAYGKQIIMSEQPTPEQFTDVPQVYQKVLDGMQDYSDFEVNIGTVHLTNPPQLHGGQTAVLNTKGTLIFAKPAANLSQDQWRQFFTSFSIIQ